MPDARIALAGGVGQPRGDRVWSLVDLRAEGGRIEKGRPLHSSTGVRGRCTLRSCAHLRSTYHVCAISGGDLAGV